MVLKIVGAGLGRTGTTSLAKALELLGYKTLHWEPKRLADIIDGTTANPNWRRYDDVDAVTDVPAALFWRELLEAYPDSKCILTIRDTDEWYDSMLWLMQFQNRQRLNFWKAATKTHRYTYGTDDLTPLLAKKRYEDHNRLVQLDVPAERLLVLNIRDGWQPLCQFLGMDIPAVPFPHANKRSG